MILSLSNKIMYNFFILGGNSLIIKDFMESNNEILSSNNTNIRKSNIISYFRENFFQTLLLLLTTFTSVLELLINIFEWNFFQKFYFLIPYIIAVVLIPILSFLTLKIDNKKNDEIKDLKSINRDLAEYQQCISTLLQYPLIKFLFNLTGGESNINRSFIRATLYRYDNESNEFVILSRFSSNNEYNKKNKVSYPNNGIIKRTWDDGYHAKRFSNPEIDYKKWVDEIYKHFRIQKRQIRSINMKSMQLIGFAIEINYLRNAVLIIESTKGDLIEDEVKKVYNELEKEFVDLLTNTKNFVPNQSLANVIEGM